MENVRQNILIGTMADTTFGGFMTNGAAGSTSTQMPVAPEADDVLRDFRTAGGAEDDVFTELMDFDQFDHIEKHIDEYMENDQNTLAKGFGAATGGSTRPTSKSSGPSTVAQAELKQLELQTKLLVEQRAQIQKDNDRLQSEVAKLNEKCQTKDGEVSQQFILNQLI